jgi:iron complex transport system substrate-binding protein
MNNRVFRGLMLACLLLAGGVAAPAAAGAAALEITDDRGVVVSLPAPPRRIVSLLPSLAETVCALGQCARLVGVDRYTNWPDSVKALPRLGGGLDPDIEAVVALKPDLVLLATSSRAAARLQSLGLKVVALEPRSLADVRRVLLQTARLLGLPERDGLLAWLRIETELGTIAQGIPPRSRGGSVYFEVSSTPHAAGEASFIGEMLARLGSRNIVPAAMGPFPALNPEYVVRADPDLIMIGDELFTGLARRPGWASMRAVREQRVCVFTPAQADVLVRAGPRLAEGARLMAGCLSSRAPTKPVVSPGAAPLVGG